MFITKEQIKDNLGVDIDAVTLATAQMMIEAYIGKSENDVADASDRATLGRAVAFQAVYIKDQRLDVLEQIGVTQMDIGSTTYQFNDKLFSPYMSPWAVQSCKGLSWYGTRSVKTGPATRGGVGMSINEAWRRDYV